MRVAAKAPRNDGGSKAHNNGHHPCGDGFFSHTTQHSIALMFSPWKGTGRLQTDIYLLATSLQGVSGFAVRVLCRFHVGSM